MSARFRVVPKGHGLFSVESEHEVFAAVSSRQVAQDFCDRINSEPGRNPFDVFVGGLWAARNKTTKEAT